jgi:phosphate starvation-inducible PhoH-like protein
MKHFAPLNSTQEDLFHRLVHPVDPNDAYLVVAEGPAGTGKTLTAAAAAAWHLQKGYTVALLRPNVPLDKGLGFLPGDLDEKLLPWAQPQLNQISKFLEPGKLEYHLRKGHIQLTSLEHVRGRSFDRSFLLLDEAQNASWAALKALSTRLEIDSVLCITGDLSQKDTKGEGLATLLSLIDAHPEVGWFSYRFTEDDIVRSDFVGRAVKLYHRLSL